MFCPKCGNQCEDGQRFCNDCGAPLDAAPAADEPVAEEPVTEETAAAAEEAVGEVSEAAAAAGEAVEETPEFEQPPVEQPTPEQPVFVSPFEQPEYRQPAPQYQPPAFQPQETLGQFPEIPPVPLKKKSGVGRWIVRIVISCLPLLLTYLALFVSGIIWPGSLLPTNPNPVLSSWAPEARTIAIVILAVICASVLLQIICLAVWALRKKGDPALRDWAVGFTVVALAVVVAAILFSLGMMLFNDNYPRLFSFLEGYVAPVRYIGLLISVL